MYSLSVYTILLLGAVATQASPLVAVPRNGFNASATTTSTSSASMATITSAGQTFTINEESANATASGLAPSEAANAGASSIGSLVSQVSLGLALSSIADSETSLLGGLTSDVSPIPPAATSQRGLLSPVPSAAEATVTSLDEPEIMSINVINSAVSSPIDTKQPLSSTTEAIEQVLTEEITSRAQAMPPTTAAVPILDPIQTIVSIVTIYTGGSAPTQAPVNDQSIQRIQTFEIPDGISAGIASVDPAPMAPVASDVGQVVSSAIQAFTVPISTTVPTSIIAAANSAVSAVAAAQSSQSKSVAGGAATSTAAAAAAASSKAAQFGQTYNLLDQVNSFVASPNSSKSISDFPSSSPGIKNALECPDVAAEIQSIVNGAVSDAHSVNGSGAGLPVTQNTQGNYVIGGSDVQLVSHQNQTMIFQIYRPACEGVTGGSGFNSTRRDFAWDWYGFTCFLCFLF